MGRVRPATRRREWDLDEHPCGNLGAQRAFARRRLSSTASAATRTCPTRDASAQSTTTSPRSRLHRHASGYRLQLGHVQHPAPRHLWGCSAGLLLLSMRSRIPIIAG
ncbi:hypothetical protein ON010_g16703 [Phytophthora cinnamomi]|nr:hypothetical protein ON010_g16703 [Phytophthora cinnamomi]